MTVLDIHPEASAEFIAALAWYEDQRVGLGAELDAAVYRADEAGAENAKKISRRMAEVHGNRTRRTAALAEYHWL